MVTRHNKVQRELPDVLEVEMEKRRKRPTGLKQGQTKFVRQGKATADIRIPRLKPILDREHDWKLKVDLDRLSLIHISEPTRPLYISYAVFCLKKDRQSL